MDPSLVEKRNRRLRIAQEQRAADLKVLAGTPHGQRFFGAFLDETCGLYAGTYNASAPDVPSNTIYEEGRRSVGVDLFLELQHAAPAELAALMLARTQAANEELARIRREAVPKQGES